MCHVKELSAPMKGLRLAAQQGEGINRVGDGANHPPPPYKQELAMKKFILAAIAALSLGIGSADAHPTVTNNLGQTIWGPAYSSGYAGG
jgi:hypothetical protein